MSALPNDLALTRGAGARSHLQLEKGGGTASDLRAQERALAKRSCRRRVRQNAGGEAPAPLGVALCWAAPEVRSATWLLEQPSKSFISRGELLGQGDERGRAVYAEPRL